MTSTRTSFLSLVKENINFPVEVKTYIENLFLLPLNQNEQVKPILLDAGRQFFKTSCNEVSQGIQDWEKTVKNIALATEKKVKNYLCQLGQQLQDKQTVLNLIG